MRGLLRWWRVGIWWAVVGISLAAAGGSGWAGTVLTVGVDDPLDDPGLATYFHPSSQYTPGAAVTVGLKATQFAWGNHLRVEDTFPTGWTVASISHSGTVVSGKVVWQFPHAGGETVTLTYTATPPAGTTGTHWFRAVATFSSDSTSQQTPADRPILPLGSSCILDCGAVASVSSGTAPLAVQFTGSASPQGCSGSISYNWTFGDGSAPSTAQNPSHTYTSAGTYTWTMTATVEGVSCTRSGTVSVSACTLGCTATANPTSGGAPLAVQFQGGATTNCAGGVSYDWDFGDGSPHSSQQNPSHTYVTPGTFTWKLTVTAGGQSCTRSGTITVSTCAVTCSATASALAGRPPLAVTFNVSANPGTCSGTLVRSLDFGDGSTPSSATTVTHTYTSQGIYQWRFVASVGSVSCEQSGRVMVSNAPAISTPWARTFIVSNSAHSAGAQGTKWVSDMVLHNPGTQTVNSVVYYLEKDADNSDALGWSVTVPAGRSVKLPDVVAQTFARSSSSGALKVGASGELIITSRTYNDAAAGTYGQYIEGYPTSRAVPAGEEARLIQLTRNTEYRTNIGFANAKSSNLSLRLDLYRADGSLLGTRNVSLKAYSYTQLNDVLAAYGTSIAGAYAIVTSSTAGGAFFTYASVIDNRTGDPVSVVPVGRGVQALSNPLVPEAEASASPQTASEGFHDVSERADEWLQASNAVSVLAFGSNVTAQLGKTNTPFVQPVPVEIPGVQDAVQISTGASHTVIRLANRSLLMVGANNSGQIGDRTFTHRPTPVTQGLLADIRDVSAGADRTLAVKQSDGTVWEWGSGSDEPRQVAGLSQVTQAVGRNHRVVLRSNASVWAWGNNSYGQLGIGNNTGQTAPTQVLGLSAVKGVSVGEWHTLALTQDGRVFAWGLNSSGQLGDGTNDNRNLPVQVLGLSGIQAISAGSYASYALGSDGKVYAWGSNGTGELGDGTNTSRNTPVAVVGLSGVAQVAGGWAFALARRSDGTVWGWGYNSDGELGDGTREQRLTPVRVQNVSGATFIAAGDWQSYAIVAGGRVRSWGVDAYGQLGVGRNVYSTSAAVVPAAGDLVATAAAGGHTLGVRSDGRVVSWGLNSTGQLGYETDWATSETPRVVPGVEGVLAVAAGSQHSLALTSQGEVWAWGGNTLGQLANGTTTSRFRAARVSGLPRITAIASGSFHCLALAENGTIWVWGANHSGQLGLGDTATRLTATELASPSGVISIATGASHSLSITSDKGLWVWGDNSYRQLGDGGTANRSVPYRHPTMTDVVQAAGGALHSMTLRNDRSVWAWGSNRSGQLGLGSTVSSASVPTRVTGVFNVERILAGREHSVAMQGSSGISVWGRNWLGQLGDSTTITRFAPTLLYALNEVFAAAAGDEHTVLLSGTVPCLLTCSASASPTSGAPPLAVSFSGQAQATGCASIPTLSWSFGDGSPAASGANVSHTYTTAGVYTWTMTATAGSSTCVRSGEIAAGSTCGTPATPEISAPQHAASDADYTVGWSGTSPDGAYELQEALQSDFSDAQVFEVGAASHSFRHSVTRDTRRHYRVRAVDACGSQIYVSPWSLPVQVLVKPPTGQILYVMAAAHLSGVAGTNWRTDMEVHNPTAAAATFRIELLRRDMEELSPQSITRTLAGGQSERFADVLSLLFSYSGAATLRITPTVGRVMVTSRTYNDQPEGTFGQFIPAAALVEAIPFGQPARLVQLTQSASSNQGFRTNVGFVNTTDRTITLDGRMFAAAGTLLGTQTWQLRAYESRQIDRVFTKVTSAEVADGFIVINPRTVGGAFLAYASVIDNRSGDPVFVPARVPEQGRSGREELVLSLPGGVPLAAARIPAGSFLMGSPAGERSREENEGPQHQVSLTRDFYLGTTEVTQGQWKAVMGNLPTQDCGRGDERPVCQVSWNDIAGPGGFLSRLNDHLQATGQIGAGSLRLPTEAEWEYAARAGSTSRFSFGDAMACDDQCGACSEATAAAWWCGNNSPDGVKPAAQKQPNGFGLYDVHGNLWEWVADVFGPYSSGSQVDPVGPPTGATRVARGGSYPSSLRNCRSARRLAGDSAIPRGYIGFRVALNP